MSFELTAKHKINIKLYEDYDCGEGYDKYPTNAHITWNVINIADLRDGFFIRVERIHEDDDASEIYNEDDEFVAMYRIKKLENHIIGISKDAILEALRTGEQVQTEIIYDEYVSGEVLEYEYESGEELTKEEIEKDVLGYLLEDETILVEVTEE